MKPHADFECLPCGQALGDPVVVPVVHEDLPVDAKFCPECGAKDGFTRLYNAVNVMGGNTRQLGKLLDDKLKPLYERHSTTKAGADSFEKKTAEAMERTYAVATTAERAQLANAPLPRVMPASSALGMVSPQARQDTRECITPALMNRKVKPQWEK